VFIRQGGRRQFCRSVVARPGGIHRQQLHTIVSLRQHNPRGLIDHFAISVETFNRDAVTQVLNQHGLTPDQNIEFGSHVKDPDGAVVQIV
jgi:hypothetical protein